MMNKSTVLMVLGIVMFSGIFGLGSSRRLGAQPPRDGGVNVNFDVNNLEAQARRDQAEAAKAASAMAGVFMMVALVATIVGLAIAVVVIVLLSGCLKVLPAQYRLMEPGMVWLMLIPLFNLVWVFFVTKRISRSYQQYFASKARTEFGDCAEKIGLWYAISTVCSVVPCLNYIAGPAALVLLIVYLVKVLGYKKFVTA